MQDYTYTLKHTFGVENKIVDALSRRTCVLKQLNAEIVCFERIKEECVMPRFWRDFWCFESRGDTGEDGFLLQDDYLF